MDDLSTRNGWLRGAVGALAAALLIAGAAAPAAAAGCADSTDCKGNKLCHAGTCVTTAAVDALCPASTACPKAYSWTYFFLDLFCADKLDDKRLALVRSAVDKRRIDEDGLATVFNMHGAMYGHRFTQLTHLDRFYYDPASAYWLPASCVPLVKRFDAASAVPASFTRARDAVKAYWRMARGGADDRPTQLPAASPELSAATRACDLRLELDHPLVKALASNTPLREGGTAGGQPFAEVSAAGQRWFVARRVDDEGEATCHAFEVRRPGRTTTGRFLAGPREVEAVALSSEPCSHEGCPLMLAFFADDGALLFSAIDDLTCDAGVDVARMRVFAGRDSLRVGCRSSMGAAWREEVLLADVRDGALTWPLRVYTGMHEYLTHDEQEAGDCPIHPVGWMRVIKAGAAPVVRTFDAGDGGEAGVGVEQEHRWSEPTRAFAPSGAAKKVPYEARRCR